MRRGSGMRRRGPLLVFGTSADPPHWGHIELVTQAVHALQRRLVPVSNVLIVPVYRRNPVGTAKPHLPGTFDHRLEMAQLAAQLIQKRVTVAVRAGDIERRLVRRSEQPNRTAETLAALGDTFRGLLFLLSADLLAGDRPEFSQWYRVDRILEAADLVITPRAGYVPNESYLASLVAQGARLHRLPEVAVPEISASAIRAALRNGADPLSLSAQLPRPIALYIKEHGLYTRGAAPAASG